MTDETKPHAAGNGQAPETPEQARGLELAEEPQAPDAQEALRRENADLRDQLLRRRADFENYKKRVERERASAGHDAVAALLKDLVPQLDNLERALQAGGDGAALKDGVLMIQRGLVSALEAHGLRSTDPHGLAFDPESHQALSYDEAPGHEDGTVVQVFAKGYFHRERLLRPALVQVARGAAPADAAAQPASATEPAREAPADDAIVTDTLH